MRFQNLVFIIFAILTIGVFLKINSGTKEYTHLVDEYESKKELSLTLDIQIPDEGSYESKIIEDKELLIYDFDLLRNVNVFNLETLELTKSSEYPELGRGYNYSGKLYDIYSQYLEVWDEGNNSISKKQIFSDTVYSSVYYENFAIVSLYRYGGVHGVDLNTQKIVWSIYDEEKLSSHMKLNIVDDTLYYLAKGTIYALSPQSGDVLMSKKGDYGEPYMIEDNIMYTSGEKLKRVDMNTWETMNSVDTSVYSMVFDERFIYVIDYSNEVLRKLSKITLEQVWEVKIYTSVAWDIILMDNHVGVVNYLGQVALVSKESGSVDWVHEFDSSHRIYGYHANLFVVGENGRIMSFDTTN